MTPKEYWEMLRGKTRKTTPQDENLEPRCHSIPEEVYGELGQQIARKIGNANYVAGIRARVITENFDYELVLSAVIRWKDVAAPDGNYRDLEKIVPIWWELHSYAIEDGNRVERLNDAIFDKIHEQIIAL